MPRRGGAGKWALLTLLAAVALGAQVLAIQFPAWTQDQATRDIYVLACKVIGCDLPALRAVADIDVAERTVEALATPSDTLELRASLVNRAAFTQPLPRLELRFTNADGDVVAQHRIPPAATAKARRGVLRRNRRRRSWCRWSILARRPWTTP